MRTKIISIFLCCAGMLTAQDYDKRGEIKAAFLPAANPHYQDEYAMEEVVDEAAWVGQQGLHVAFASTDRLYFRREKPDVDRKALSLEQTAWRGERVNAQLLVWSSDPMEQVRVELTGLKSGGNEIASDRFTLNLVRYVIGNYPYADKTAVCGESPFPHGFMLPDRFEEFDRFDLPGKTVRPVWLSVDIPSDASAGTYTGSITVKSVRERVEMAVTLHVQDQVLPDPHDWKHRLDLWQNPWVVAWQANLTPWSEEHKTLLKQHLKPYAEAGGTYITTYAVHSPWSDNSFRVEGGMIDWIKQKNGTWKFDYTIFDEYVKLCMSCGIDRAITLYTAIPWGNRFRYLDETTGNYVYESWEPEGAAFAANWEAFLTDLRAHLEREGWFDMTYIGINENAMEQTVAAIRVIKNHSKDWRITYAGDWHESLDALLDDYSLLYPNEPGIDEIKARRERGVSTTYYVCCNPPVPNNFLFSPPIEGRWISWYSAAKGYDGFLRWAYDAWPEDPNRDARHGSWAAGDCFLVYPGGHSCIRFEKLREGIVDYEKIRIVREKASRYPAGSRVANLLKELDNLLHVFPQEKDFDELKIAADVAKGKKILDEISYELK